MNDEDAIRVAIRRVVDEGGVNKHRRRFTPTCAAVLMAVFCLGAFMSNMVKPSPPAQAAQNAAGEPATFAEN